MIVNIKCNRWSTGQQNVFSKFHLSVGYFVPPSLGTFPNRKVSNTTTSRYHRRWCASICKDEVPTTPAKRADVGPGVQAANGQLSRYEYEFELAESWPEEFWWRPADLNGCAEFVRSVGEAWLKRSAVFYPHVHNAEGLMVYISFDEGEDKSAVPKTFAQVGIVRHFI